MVSEAGIPEGDSVFGWKIGSVVHLFRNLLLIDTVFDRLSD